MRPQDVRQAHLEQSKELRDLASAPLESMERAANEIARMVRADAQQHGRAVGIRVVRKPSGVRVTVTGPSATRYRRVVEDRLRARVPGIQAEVRAQITRKP